MAQVKRKVHKRDAGSVLAAVAVWMGKNGMTEDGSPSPTGRDAAYRALGPQLIMDWDWPGKPTPTILLEGGPEDWAIRIRDDEQFQAGLKALGLWTEPYASYALCIYLAD